MSDKDKDDASLPSDIFDAPGAYPPTPGDFDGLPPDLSQLTLTEAIERRRAEFTKQYNTKIKIGTWNVASLSGTEKDVAGWFIGGKGLSDKLSGVAIETRSSEDSEDRASSIRNGAIEDPHHQEQRRSKKKSTIPHHDIAYVSGHEDIGIYALGLQEIVDIGSAVEAIRPYSDPQPARLWREAVKDGLPQGYQLVAEQQLIGLLLLIYASPTIAPQISHVSATNVGTGAMGVMGNKGAVTARIVLGETTTLLFVNCHLTAGTEKKNLERRNWDAQQIVSRTKFEGLPKSINAFGKSDSIGDEDFAFWFGDLNYRLEDIPGEEVRRLLEIHTQKVYENSDKPTHRNEHKIQRSSSPIMLLHTPDNDGNNEHTNQETVMHSSPDLSTPYRAINVSGAFPDEHDGASSTPDPSSLQTTLNSLLPHDQLHKQMRSSKAFHDGWREGPISFLPTYKYDAGSIGMFDSSEKKRAPSWCDRILYRTKKDKEEHDVRAKERFEAEKRDKELRERGLDKAADEDESVFFEYDPDTDAADGPEGSQDKNNYATPLLENLSGSEEHLTQEIYTSHQRVLSSDHKPLDSVFSLTYDAVDADAKAQIHTEVAKELDKAENEGRPVLAVVADQHDPSAVNQESVDFGHIKYDSPKKRSLTVANTGRVPATFSFAPRGISSEGDGSVTPNWITINFEDRSSNTPSVLHGLQEITLQPGDAIGVQLTAVIKDISMVRRLNEKVDTLEDVLVLRVKSGRDFFIPLRGEWLRSAFGHSIEKLVKIPEGGIRKLQHQRPQDSNPETAEVKWSSPKEIFRLTEAIENLVERALAEWDMISSGRQTPPRWKSTGWPFEDFTSDVEDILATEEAIRDALDNDQELRDAWPAESGAITCLESTAKTLLAFITNLEDGVMLECLWADNEREIIATRTSKGSTTDLRLSCLERLQAFPCHSISLTLILVMLQKVIDELIQVNGQANTNSKESIQQQQRAGYVHHYAGIFANGVIRAPTAIKEKETRVIEQRKKMLMEILISGS